LNEEHPVSRVVIGSVQPLNSFAFVIYLFIFLWASAEMMTEVFIREFMQMRADD